MLKKDRILKKIIFLYSISASIFFSSCTKKDKIFNLTMAEVNPVESISGKFAQEFCDKVYKYSEGTIKITLQAGGALGDETSVLREIITNKSSHISFSRISPFSLTVFGCSKSALINIPFTFKNREHFWNFTETEMANEILNEPEEKNLGIKGICFGEEGFRHFFSAELLKDISDFEGKTLRITDDKVLKQFAEDLGTVYSFVPFDSLFMKIKTGDIEIAENPISNYVTNDFSRVAPYLLLSGHSIGALEIIVNKEVWNKFSDRQKEAVLNAGKDAQNYCKAISEKLEQSIITSLKNTENVTITEIMDKDQWRSKCKNVIEENSKDHLDLYSKILELSK